jgi:hypothetical protein
VSWYFFVLASALAGLGYDIIRTRLGEFVKTVRQEAVSERSIMRNRLSAIFFWVVAALASVCLGQGTPPDYGFTWRTIGAPGNAPATQADFPFDFPGPRGGVDYPFRMSQTEITVSRFFDFVQAYTTVYPNTPISGLTGLSSPGIYRTGSAGSYQWHMFSGVEQLPAEMPWMYAATYCNWLCNGEGVTAAAFASGAYDTGTFYPNPGPPQMVHTPGAAFWLPSLDEWTKAMYYDPNKNGPGQAGYWWYPISSDTPPVGGPPGTPGAQTGVGSFVDPNNPSHDYPVGSYPNAQSPWGLLDGSGGVTEWCEGYPGGVDDRYAMGSRNQDVDTASSDRIDLVQLEPFWSNSYGIRLASAVPAPGAGVLLLLSLGAILPRRR